MRLHLGIGLLCLATLGCATPEAHTPVRDARECYVLDWRRGDSALALHWIPDSIELSTKAQPYRPVAGTARFELYRASIAPDTVHVTPEMGPDAMERIPWYRHLFNHWWETLPGDSVWLNFSDNSIWLDARLARTEAGLVGVATVGSHAGNAAPAQVTGRRFRCRGPQQVGA